MAGGESSNEGRVEICIDGVWGTVCDGGWELCVDNWGSLDQVLHNFGLSNISLPPVNSIMLIFCLVISVLYSHQHNFGEGTGPVFLYDVGCTGTESTLLNCCHSGIRFNWCSHSNDAGVCVHVGVHVCIYVC